MKKIIPVGKSFLSLRRLLLRCLPCCSSPSLEGLLLYSSTLLFRNWGGPAIFVTKQQQHQHQIQQRRGKFENWKGDKSHRKLVTSEKASKAEGRPEEEGGLGRWLKMDLSPREGWPTAAAASTVASSSECSMSESLVWSWSGSSSAEE